MNATQHVTTLGQSLWLDNLSRSLLRDGTLEKLIAEDGVSGVTSNPSIFQNALASSPHYADDLARLKAGTLDARISPLRSRMRPRLAGNSSVRAKRTSPCR